MQCEPATSLINRLGGLTKVSGVCGVNVSTVQRWRMPREKGGTGGFIPHWHARRLLDHAAKEGIAVKAEDFFVSEASQAFDQGRA